MKNRILTEITDLGTITAIDEVSKFKARPIGSLEGSQGARAGFSQMIGMLSGHTSMQGFKIQTSKHEFLVLIDDEQSCCEDYGSIHSADDLDEFVGSELYSVRLTDTALNQTIVDRHGCGEYGFHEGGIQFIDFYTSTGKLQFAVYNSHNGYYGHGIVVAMDMLALAEDTL